MYTSPRGTGRVALESGQASRAAGLVGVEDSRNPNVVKEFIGRFLNFSARTTF